MSEGQDRTGETYQLVTGVSHAVQVFLVLASKPGMVPGNWRDRPGYRHEILILDPGNNEDGIIAGRVDVLYETADCETFTHHYKRIGSDLSTVG